MANKDIRPVFKPAGFDISKAEYIRMHSRSQMLRVRMPPHTIPFKTRRWSLSLQFCGRRLDGISPCKTPTCQPLVIRWQIIYIYIYVHALLCIYVKCAVCIFVLNDMIYVIFWRSALDWVGEDDLTTPLRHAQPSRSVWKWTTEHWPKSCVRKVEMRLKRSRRLPKRLGVPSEAWHPPIRNGNPWV